MSNTVEMPRLVRAAEFRARIGGISRSHWHALRANGLIPAPIEFAGIQFWSEEVVAEFVRRVLAGELPCVVRRPGRPRKHWVRPSEKSAKPGCTGQGE
jgi:hypothetical protein